MSSSETASSYSLCFPVRRTKKVLTAFTLFGCSTSTGVANIYLRHDASVHLQEKSREKSFKKNLTSSDVWRFAWGNFVLRWSQVNFSPHFAAFRPLVKSENNYLPTGQLAERNFRISCASEGGFLKFETNYCTRTRRSSNGDHSCA